MASLIEQIPARDLVNEAAALRVHGIAVELALHQQLSLGGHPGGGAGPVTRFDDRVETVVSEGEGGEQKATRAQDAGDLAKGRRQVVEVFEQFVADHQIEAGSLEVEPAEILMGQALASGIVRIGEVFADDHPREEAGKGLGEGGDGLREVDVNLRLGGDPPLRQQAAQQEQDGAMAGEAAVVFEAFPVVRAREMESACRHGPLTDRIEDAVQGHQGQGLLHLPLPLGVGAVEVVLKAGEILEAEMLHVGGLPGGLDGQRAFGWCALQICQRFGASRSGF